MNPLGVRATYVFAPSQIKKLKDLLLPRKPGLVRVSSFVVTTAFVRTCFAKSVVAASAGDEQEVRVDGEEFFGISVDGRALLDPPVPGNYFGNCIGFAIVKIKHQDLVGEEGFFTAAEAIATEIQKKIGEKELLADVQTWMVKWRDVLDKPLLTVSGSNKIDMCGPDFGWGRMRKLELLSIDGEKYAMSLCKSSDGGMEIGLSLPKIQMDAFAACFAELFMD